MEAFRYVKGRCFNTAGSCFPDEYHLPSAHERPPGIRRII